MTRIQKQGGYTLLFAVFTATLVLGVAVFILDVSRKQHELAVAARNSIYSFYAADSAIECAISAANWTNLGGFASTSATNTLRCGTDIGATIANVSPQGYPANMIFATAQNPIKQNSGYISLSFNDGDALTNACALVTVTTGSSEAATDKPITIIEARGYNLCTSDPVGPDTANSSTVERALRLIQTGVW